MKSALPLQKGDLRSLLPAGHASVALLSSALPLPLVWAHHFWLVLRWGDALERWEFGRFRGSPHPGGIGILKDFLPPEMGMNRFPQKNKPRHQAYLHARRVLEGEEITRLKERLTAYPWAGRYAYLGPNSNTYVAWVIKPFPHWHWQLPQRAVGRNWSGLTDKLG